MSDIKFMMVCSMNYFHSREKNTRHIIIVTQKWKLLEQRGKTT